MSDANPDADTVGDPEEGGSDAAIAVVLDVLPNGRPGEGRSRFDSDPIAYALAVEPFHLLEFDLDPEVKLFIGDRVAFDPPGEAIRRVRDVDHGELSGAARSELEYAVEEVVEADERRFVDFFNDAQAITTRLHALNLLPGIGKKLRNDILDERKRGPFESFDELDERISGLHRPKEVLVERIMEELQEEDLKYRIWAKRDSKR
jgi:putative nucleotide binding protein